MMTNVKVTPVGIFYSLLDMQVNSINVKINRLNFVGESDIHTRK